MIILERLRCASLLLAAASCLLPLTPARAQNISKDLTYTVGPEGPELGDLYEPNGAGPFPAIVYIHGGSWRSGNKKVYRRLATDLAASGYVGFAINYDLHAHSYPVSFQEAQAAVRFLRRHAVAYRIDPNQIVVAGDSAGGEIAALVALSPQGPVVPAKNFIPVSDGTPATVSAAIIFNGVFRLATEKFKYIYIIGRYLGGHCKAQPAACEDAAPFQHIHAGDPPFFVGHGTSDHTVPYSEAEVFIDALRKHHVPVSTYVAHDGHHSYWRKSAFYAPNLAAVKTFLAQALPSHP